MDEYAASCSRVERLISAAQFMKQSLICSICLDLFKEPVTIKCGHKFCRECILQVANNENPVCPCCNVKFQKRSIPKEGNEVLKTCIERFQALTEAILLDSGIDVSQPHNKVKHTKESAPDNAQLPTAKIEVTPSTSKASSSITNQKSAISKVCTGKNLSLRQKPSSFKVKTPSLKKNTLDKYFVPSEDKVKSWLENLSTDTDDVEKAHSNCEDAHPSIKSSDKVLKPVGKSPVTESEEGSDSVSKNHASTSKVPESDLNSNDINQDDEEPKYKELQMRLQQAEMMAKKKTNQILPDKTVLKTPGSVPAASHSDAYDWRRVKRVGKEMQKNTFKSLDVSVEKSSSSVVLDDTVPYSSVNNDSRNVSRQSDTNNDTSSDVPVSETKRKALSKINNNSHEKESPKNVIQDRNKHHSIDSSCSHKDENTSLTCMDEEQMNEIIGVGPLPNNSRTPEQARHVSSALNQEYPSKLNRLSSLKTKENDQEIELSSDESSAFDSKITAANPQPSPSRSRLSLKSIPKTSTVSKPIRSQPGTPDKAFKIVSDSPKKYSPERARSKLSLRLPTVKTSEHSSNQKKSPVKPNVKTSEHSSNQKKSPVKPNVKISEHSSNQKKSPVKIYTNIRPLQSSKHPIVFKKLGRICKKPKNISFLYLGKLRPKDHGSSSNHDTSVVIKSNVPANFDYKSMLNESSKVTNDISANIVPTHNEIKLLSPQKDSQLKFLSVDSPQQQQNVGEKINPKENEDQFDECTNVPMEVDEYAPIEKEIPRQHLDFREKDVNNDKMSKIVENVVETTVNQNIADQSSPKTCLEKTKALDMPMIFQPESSPDIGKYSRDIDSETPEDLDVLIDKVQDDVISVSSHESEFKNSENQSNHKTINIAGSTCRDAKNTDGNSEVESIAGSISSPDSILRTGKKKRPRKCISSSPSTASPGKSPINKKRSHSESSNDDDDVTSIIGKWCDPVEEPKMKKPKVITNSKEMTNKSRHSEVIISDDDDDHALMNDASELQRDPPIDDIISKVKSFKENDIGNNKLSCMPSSLHSADLFESSEHPIVPPNHKRIRSDISSVDMHSPNGRSDKENLSSSPNISDITMIDLLQFNKKKAGTPERSNSIIKQNSVENQAMNTGLTKTSESTMDEIESSQNGKHNEAKNHNADNQSDPYYVPDSLMNITEEQVALKNIEKELIGVDLSEIHTDKNEGPQESNKFTTPPKKTKQSQISNNGDDFDSDNIDATPVVKRRQICFPVSKSGTQSDSNISDIFSPEKNIKLIPAVTPVRNTKSYPLSHSTPMVNTTPSPVKKRPLQTRNITLICSGLQSDNLQTVHNFVTKFNANFQTNFDTNVTHVIVHTDPSTRVGQKTFKYMQGIAFKKHVVSFQWIVDCLENDTLLNEDAEKYEVLDPDVLESGSKRSRLRTQELYRDFTFYCLEPFTSFSLIEFKNLLLFNGATVANTLKDLALEKNKHKIVILESENLSQTTLSMIKKTKSILVSFEWIVDSISQWQVLSLYPYLCELSTVEEARALGFPPDLLAEDETTEGDYEDES